MDIEDKLRQSGVNVDRSRLAEQTYETLRRVNKNPERAAHIIMQQVLADVRLLNELLGINVRARVEQYVQERLQDMQGLAGRGSHPKFDSQAIDDPTPATDLPDASQSIRESLSPGDRSGTPFPGASHRRDDSRRASDRPRDSLPKGGESQFGPESRGSGDLPTPPASVSPGMKAAAAAVVRTAADYKIPGTYGRRLGSITRRDWLNLSVHSAIHSELNRAIAKRVTAGEIGWQDNDTPMEKVTPPAVLLEVQKEVDDAAEQAIRNARLVHGG